MVEFAPVASAWPHLDGTAERAAGRSIAPMAARPIVGTSDRAARILVVDDEPQIVEFLCLLLEDEGYEARRAYDGAEAWEKLRRDPADLIISDVMMPRLTGTQLVQRLKESFNGTCPPVILMSAVTQPRVAPGVRFVAKPFDIDRMLDPVSELVES